MSRRISSVLTGLVVLGAMVSLPSRGHAQNLAQRVAGASGSAVQFSYASREGVCGDGRLYYRINISPNSNEFYGTWNDGINSQPCIHGPIRIVLQKAGGAVVGLRIYAGPPGSTEGATDLGMVRARDASEYLLSLVSTAEGSVSRDAITPAMLADSVNNQAALLAIARDQTRARETRRSAISWLGRDGGTPAAVSQPLVAIAMDENDNQTVRQQALRTLAHLDGGAGIPELTRLAGDPQGGWVAREALSSIAQSGDPRAREYLRGVVRRAELPDEALATAIRSFGQQYATATDIQIIREAWPKLTGQRAQDAALSAVTEFGGAENARWLLGLAQNVGLSSNNQHRALQDAVRAGAKVSDLVTLYNGTADIQMKGAIIDALAQSGDRAATDKLLAIAKDEDVLSVRRKAISALGRSSDPRVKKELEALVEHPSRS